MIPELTWKSRLPKRPGGVKTTLAGETGTKIPCESHRREGEKNFTPVREDGEAKVRPGRKQTGVAISCGELHSQS